MWEIQVWSLGLEDTLEEEMATQSSILAWKSPWTEESGRPQSIGLQRVGHDWAHTRVHTHTHAHTHTLHYHHHHSHLKEEQVSMAEVSFVCRHERGTQSSNSFALYSSYWFLSHRPITKRLICSCLWFFETWSSFDIALKVIPRGKGIRTLQCFWATQTLSCLLHQLFTGTAVNSSDVICHLP